MVKLDADALVRCAVGLFGTTVVVLYFLRYAPGPNLPPLDLGLLTFPETGKLAAAARSLAGLAVLSASAWCLGGPMQRLLCPEGEGDALAAPHRLALGFLLLANAVLLLAALRLLHPLLLGALVLLPLAPGARGLAAGLRAALPALRRSPWSVAAALVLLASPFLAAFVPDYGWDGFTYHLAVPERYLFENRIVVTPFSPFSTFPHLMEMLYLLALAFDPGPLTKLLHWEMGVLAAWAVFALAARVSRRAGLLALAVLASCPVFFWEMRVAYNDLATGLFGLLAAAALHDGLQDGRMRSFLRCGVLAGACAATRYTGVAMLPAVLAALWLPPRLGVRHALRASAAVAGGAFAVILPWLVRNLVATGNPVSPALQDLFHAEGSEYYPATVLAQIGAHLSELGMGRSPLDLLRLPWNLTLEAQPGMHAGFGFLVGPLFLVGTAACLLAPRARRAPVVATLLRVAALAGLFWFVTYQEPRYLTPELACLAVAGGVGFDALLPAARSAAHLLLALPAAAVLHTQATPAVMLPWWYGYGLGRLSLKAYQDQEPALVAARRLRETLGPGDRVLLVFEGRGFFFRGLDYIPFHTKEGSKVLQVIHEAEDPQALRQRLGALGVTHVLVNAGLLERYPIYFVPGYGPQDLAADIAKLHAFLEAYTTPLHAERGVMVRALRPAGVR